MLRRSISLLVAGSLYLSSTTGKPEQTDGPIAYFNVLSMSIAGLPENFDRCGLSKEDKERNTETIGQVMSSYSYSIIHVQEDFDHHATLTKRDDHPFCTESKGKGLFISGLNTLSTYPWIDFERITWKDCYGVSKYDIDCNTDKGFSFMRVHMGKGVYIDMINLHADAGTGFHDQLARRANIQEVADYISQKSTGNAVIVFGNTNSLYTRSQDNIRLLTSQNGLQDAWVQAIGGSAPSPGADTSILNCEVVDKVFYRGSPIINLNSSGFFYDTSRFRSPEGNELTDHKPVRAEFGYTLREGLRQSDLYGGPYGKWFNDLPSLPSSPKLSSMTLRGDKRLDGITLNLTSGDSFPHGGRGGKEHSIKLHPGEYVTSVKFCWGEKNGHTRNFYALATTTATRELEAGTITKDCETATAPEGYGVVGAYGQDGDEMDQLGLIFARYE